MLSVRLPSHNVNDTKHRVNLNSKQTGNNVTYVMSKQTVNDSTLTD